jgi:hypothetical protein
MTNPRTERLFDDPTARAIQAHGQLIDLMRQSDWDVGCKDLRIQDYLRINPTHSWWLIHAKQEPCDREA